VQTAEGAIAAASDMGQRILTLATQGANGTLGVTEKEAITNEMQQMRNQQLKSEGDRNSQIGGNVAMGVLGAFFILPLFFMNTGNANTVEERAAISRYERLQQMGSFF
jgi:hypothetical protein